MTADLISKYAAAARKHGEGTRTGDYKLANRSYNTLMTLLKEISRKSADNLLLTLFDNEDVWVQIWAAAHSLETFEKQARAKLQSIAESAIPLAGTNAKYTLIEWDKGNIKFRE